MKHGFKIAILFNIPKALHMPTACELNSPGQNCPSESKPMFTNTHCTAVPGCGRDTANSSSLLLFFPCPHPDWWCHCPFTNTGQNLGLILLSLSLEIDSLLDDFLHPIVKLLQCRFCKCFPFSIVFPLVQQRQHQSCLPSFMTWLFQPFLSSPNYPCLTLCSTRTDFCTVPQTHPVVSLCSDFTCCFSFFQWPPFSPYLPNELLPHVWGLRPPLSAAVFRAFPELPRKKWPLPSLRHHCPFVRILDFYLGMQNREK